MKKTESELWARTGSIEIGRTYEKRCANEDAKIGTRFFAGNATGIGAIARES
jgi:hypothetical protein